ncbi:MAG: DUF4115 domain-containing protein [Endomicrobia bacterium]|nr:DUF4115 domain-containing protein [Endomicrobiia bacterium]MCL2507131.1 DUF4115 domain-containing protein [Endomicrobiia bacterium]
MKEIGKLLKEKRESEGLTLEQAHQATRVQIKHLEALEEGDEKVFSAEVYYKSFLKSYAKYLGLDPAELISGYDARKASKEQAAEKEEGIIRKTRSAVRTVSYKKAIVTILIAACLLAAFLYLNKNISNIVSEDASAVEHKHQVVKNEVQNNIQSVVIEEIVVQPETKPVIPQKQNLLIRAVENVWIRLDGDNKPLFQGTLLKDEERTWQAYNDFVLRIGYAKGVKVFLDGKEVDVVSGSVQDVNTVTIKRQ